MTPTEKAKELIQQFYPEVQWKLGQEDCLQRAKRCVLIAVDEILKITWVDKFLTVEEYWEEVKQEIENL
jgi:hypothetical protein